MKIKHAIKLAFSIAVTAVLLVACGGGGDATAPDEITRTGSTTGGVTTATPSDTPTPTAPVEPTTGYGYVINPAGGNFGTQCAKDYATGLIWEGKSLDPADMRFVGLTFTNFDSTTALQVEFEIAGRPSVYAAPTSGQVNAESNSIGYKNAVNASALCGFTDWRLPSRNELVALGLLSSKLSDFPEVSSRAYWTNESGFDRDSTGSVLRPPATAGNKEYRGNSFGIRLVRSSR